MIKRILAFGVLIGAIGGALTGTAAPAVDLRRSESFIVRDDRYTSPFSSPRSLPAPKTDEKWVNLGPETLLISAERIKEVLYTELKLPQRDLGKISLVLKRSRGNEGEITLVSVHRPDGWKYWVEVPERVEELKLLRGLIQVLLLEIANSQAFGRSAELPMWLIEGISFHLYSIAGHNLVLESVPNGQMARKVRVVKGYDLLSDTRTFFTGGRPLSFEELSRPQADQLTGDRLKRFQHSARLFYWEMIQTPQGHERLVAMLQQLPRFWNWELALLQAFRPTFEKLLDVEKWWSVSTIAFMGQKSRIEGLAAETWSRQLHEILQAPVQVHNDPQNLPVRQKVTLPELITNWSFEYQRPILGQIIVQLALLRAQSSPKFAPIVDAYLLTLQTYLQKRAMVGYAPTSKRDVGVNARFLIQETVKRLEELAKQHETQLQADISTVAIPSQPAQAIAAP